MWPLGASVNWWRWFTEPPRPIESIGPAFFNQLRELIEKIRSVVWARCCFRMVLHTENRQFLVSHSLDRAVIQIDVCDLYVRRQRVRIDGKSVILRSDRHLACA